MAENIFLDDIILQIENTEDFNFYDEIDIKQFEYDDETKLFSYPCPCGDKFEISIYDLLNNEDVVRCPSCSLVVKIAYEESDLLPYTID
ncbi:CSL zinc finger domain-containing protein [Hamiltosporidium tvaerminnensis]|uniref:Diphthamide biosynthesis protein 3 n=3 Tax=Hamiltosporidium TaxID=1176354 RepID=A0A4Q9L149_9MICR|nr:Diphthamide biosynthesis protein 3 [Hamiltosporidium tvaerminnensis]TBT99287.1 CSL zinc finger domain-containing protein [Hamiltosporidium tvaerminnensis]TBU01093.1 CSL zinc finger domain-containing protein [Hamiltosporidium magnivora]TBU01375.1 CSL zinc finger domain-containing protein [Hamiltosporidium magnivora]